ncbi:MAG: hypothetical protein ACYDHH_23870 [Solirubrobacteraceae bacterium]
MEDQAPVVVICETEQEARIEAERRERDDPEPGQFMWSWMRLDGQWVAKRFPRETPPPPVKRHWSRVLLDGILDGLAQSGK